MKTGDNHFHIISNIADGRAAVRMQNLFLDVPFSVFDRTGNYVS